MTGPGDLPLWSAYPAFVRRRLVSLATLTVLGLLVGIALAAMTPTTYSATASVVLTPVPKYLTPSTTTLVPPAVTIDTDAQLLQSPEVLAAVADVLGGSAAGALSHLSVGASAHSRVLHITVTAQSPAAAAAAANAAASALGDVRRTTLGSLRADQVRELRLLIDQQEQLLAKERVKQVVVPEYEPLESDVLQLQSDLDALEEAQLRPLDIIDTASPPARADYRNAEVPAVSGAMVGLLCGCLLGAARDRSPRPVHLPVRLVRGTAALGRTLPTTRLGRDYHHVS
ncbi:GumC domain-containing protein [Nocardioides sp. HB32]|jgi:succinoglycan biosynthesis transport protein ExoP